MDALVNLEAEKSVVGAVIANGKCVREASVLMPDDFTDPICRTIFEAEIELYQKGAGLDIVSIGSAVVEKNPAVTPEMMLKIASYVPTTANIKTYIRMVQECSSRRKISELGQYLMDGSRNSTIDVSELLDNVRSKTRDMSDGKDSWMSMSEMSMKFFDYLERASRNGNDEIIKTGISYLDKKIGGFYKNELTVLAARPAVGKSAFGLFLAMNIAKTGKKVAIVSREMSPEAICQRAMSSVSTRLTGDKLRKVELDNDDWVCVGDAINELSRLPIMSIYNVRNVEDLYMQVQGLKERSGIDLLIVDYAQLMHTAKRIDGRTEELEAVSGALKEIAMDMEIPVIALAQVRRSGTRVAVMPTMDELKGSGAFEQDADSILLLHRPEADDDDTINPDDKELRKTLISRGLQYIVLNVAKNRQGQTGAIAFNFNPEHMTYTCIDRS